MAKTALMSSASSRRLKFQQVAAFYFSSTPPHVWAEVFVSGCLLEMALSPERDRIEFLVREFVDSHMGNYTVYIYIYYI